MCTASWWLGDGQSALCFDRDERKSRPRARRPEAFLNGAIQCLAPIDPQGGGSWLCVSERGLCAFLLNNYDVKATVPDGAHPKSRGALPIKACSFPGRAQAANWLGGADLSEYGPFFLGLLDRERCELYGWNGHGLDTLPASLDFLTTSSFRSEEVQEYRKSRYEMWRRDCDDAGDLENRLEYHLNVDHADPAFNPLMRRAESETHNVSAVQLGGDRIAFTYLERGTDSDAFATRFVTDLGCS